jgi:myb proto-oncogene protein
VEEDSTLIGAVKKLGKYWTRVAALVPGRTNRQCCQRWVVSLDPDINTFKWKVWTAEEDVKLTEAVAEFGNDWVRVAALVPGRTNDQCRHRWVMCLVVKWTVEEDKKLAQAVRKHRRGDWVRVAALVPGRTKGQCCKRWATSFTWTVEEDAKLTKAVRKHRNNWIRVAALVPGRSNAQCCRRWTKYLTPESPYNINREPDDS